MKKVKARRPWKINPVTKVEKSKLEYNRSDFKKETLDEIEEEWQYFSEECCANICHFCKDSACKHPCHSTA